jgi:hypothetical protein
MTNMPTHWYNWAESIKISRDIISQLSDQKEINKEIIFQVLTEIKFNNLVPLLTLELGVRSYIKEGNIEWAKQEIINTLEEEVNLRKYVS